MNSKGFAAAAYIWRQNARGRQYYLELNNHVRGKKSLVQLF
jgi:hypothetical protein